MEFLNKDMKRKGWEKKTQGDLRERIKRRRIIWVEFLNKDMKRKGWEKVMQVDRRERIKRRRNI